MITEEYCNVRWNGNYLKCSLPLNHTEPHLAHTGQTLEISTIEWCGQSILIRLETAYPTDHFEPRPLMYASARLYLGDNKIYSFFGSDLYSHRDILIQNCINDILYQIKETATTYSLERLKEELDTITGLIKIEEGAVLAATTLIKNYNL